MLHITETDIVARLKFDNPWWEEGSKGKVAFEDTPRRKYFAPLHRAITDHSVRRAMVLMGPRRVGKTVMLYHCIKALLTAKVAPKNILYISLETPIYSGLSLEQILIFYQKLYKHKRDAVLYVFFDEIQYLKNWEIHLKSLVDSYASYRFVATGSAAAALRLKSHESGAGRFSDYVLPPLTFAEYLMFTGRENELIQSAEHKGSTPLFTTQNIEELNKEFVNYLNFGGYPEAVFSSTIRQDPGQYIKSDIVDKVLLRDLPSLYGISDIQELNRLFTTIAYNTGHEISPDSLSKSSGASKNTIKRYLEYLEAAFLIRRVERIDQNAKRFKRAMSFKVYLTNPSMRAALFGQIGSDSKAMGALTETAIYSQWQHLKQAQLYYARWNTGEIDIVFLEGVHQQPEWAVEVKWSDRPHRTPSELNNCIEFIEKNPAIKTPFLITSKTTHTQLFYKNVEFQFIPSSLYAYAVGTNALNRVDNITHEHQPEQNPEF